MHIRKPEHTDQPPRRRIQIQEFTGNLDHRRKTRELERLSKLSESYWKRQYTTILYILEDRIDRLEAEINELDNCSDFDDFQENLETSSYMPLADPVDGNKQDPIRD
jgi:hypothetical protein